jgi:hypothetical protein
VTIRYARPGDVLGIAVLVGGPADVGVQTLAESCLFRIDAATLRWAAHRHRSDTIEMSRNGRPYTAGDIGGSG